MDANERRTRIVAEATEWCLRLHNNEMSRAQREEFVDWLRESPLHVTEMLHMAHVHNAFEQFKGWSQLKAPTAIDAQDTVVQFPERSTRTQPNPESIVKPARNHRRYGAIAAALMGVLVFVVWRLSGNAGMTIVTERGEKREMSLSDGSVLQIDPNTKLRVRLLDKERRIQLEYGRALFRVAKDAARPFFVNANDTTIRAVGTAFAVARSNESVTVTVVEGKVAVMRNDVASSDASSNEKPADERDRSRRTGPAGKVARSPANENPQASIFLVADEQVTVGAKHLPGKIRKVDSARALFWAGDRLTFENDSVAAVVAEFNRYNRMQIYVSDEALANRSISGVFDASDPQSFVAFLKSAGHIDVVRGHPNALDITIASAK